MPNEKFYRRIMFGEEEKCMKTTEFQSRFPKPWKFVKNGVTFSLQAANGAHVASLHTMYKPKDIPQKEWNRHIESGLQEYLLVVEPEADRRIERLRKHAETIAP